MAKHIKSLSPENDEGKDDDLLQVNYVICGSFFNFSAVSYVVPSFSGRWQRYIQLSTALQLSKCCM